MQFRNYVCLNQYSLTLSVILTEQFFIFKVHLTELGDYYGFYNLLFSRNFKQVVTFKFNIKAVAILGRDFFQPILLHN